MRPTLCASTVLHVFAGRGFSTGTGVGMGGAPAAARLRCALRRDAVAMPVVDRLSRASAASAASSFNACNVTHGAEG